MTALEGMPEGSCRLPTEAQWEYACRAGTDTAFCYGDDLDSSVANFNGNYPYGKGRKQEYREKTVSVGQFKPNAWGLYDMHGNVWEWCADRYGKYEGYSTDPHGGASGSDRMIRGGSWNVSAINCRSALRFNSTPFASDYNAGFRVSLPTDQLSNDTASANPNEEAKSTIAAKATNKTIIVTNEATFPRAAAKRQTIPCRR